MSGTDKNSENKVIENMTFIKQNMSELYPSAKTESDKEVKKLLGVFENLENKNIEKLEYLIKQVANFINKFENLENETILEQFEKILYSINNSRLELLEEIAKLSSQKLNLSDNQILNLAGQNSENNSEEVVNNFLSELLLFKNSNNTNLSKIYFNLKQQLEDLKISFENNNTGNSNIPDNSLNIITSNITGLQEETHLIKQIISTQNEQLNLFLSSINDKFSVTENSDNQDTKTNLNTILSELTEFKKSNNANLKNLYLNLNKKIGEITVNNETSNNSDTNISEKSIKNLTNEIAQLKNETASNSRKITILLETFNILNINIKKIEQLVEKNILNKENTK